MKEIITTTKLKPNGHYALAHEHNGFIFISGQLSICSETGEKKFGTIEDETLQALNNIKLILKEAHASIDDVIKTTIYISDMNLWDQVNKVYSDFFGSHRPARSIVPTRELHFGFKVEIEAIAIRKNHGKQDLLL